MAVSATLTGADQFSNTLRVNSPGFNVGISGTFVATVSLQKDPDQNKGWVTVKEYTGPAQEIGEDFEQGMPYRIGILTGDFTSGTAEVRLGQGLTPRAGA